MPEVIQTSAMDCGPACLTAMLAGHGARASYERLREACRTDVDGTSIDTIEEAALALGLAAEQNLVPADHVLRPEACALPAIAVTRQPDGGNHFVVIWSRLGDRVQVMDPAVGRRWVHRDHLLEELYQHEMVLPAEVWRGWAEAEDRRAPLVARLGALGVPDPAARVARALAEPGPHAVAALDAAARLSQRLVDAGALAPGAEAAALTAALADDPSGIPDDAWSARATADPATLRVRGAVIVRVTGFTRVRPESPELRAALDEPDPRPWRHLLGAVTSGGALDPIAVGATTALAALLIVVQAALWRALFDTQELTPLQLAGALGALVSFLVVELAVEAALIGGNHRLGRRVEVGLRVEVLASIARLGLRYLQSRPVSDMAERSHALHTLRELPWIGAQLVRVALTTLLTGAALAWLAPASRWLIAGLALAVLAPPLLAHGALAERELRVRTHHGAITRFFLDALLGAVPARAHGIERALRREHEARLVEWARAALGEQAFASALAALQAALVGGLSIALVAQHVASTDRPASVLLAVYWTLMMASSGGAFTALVRELPAAQNLTLRLLEPLGARGADEPVAAHPVEMGRGPIRFEGVSVVAGGHPVLTDVSLTIPEGQHVAVVGASGAGKSTLIGLLLGWHRPAAGTVRIGDVVLDPSTLDALRRRTAWVDPAVQIWNDALAPNLTFGAVEAVDLGATAVDAHLDDVLGRLPEGMQTRLGEGGGLLSGGEGQRVRFGRGLGRSRATLALLDEPFRGVDHERRRALLATARARFRGATLICATHDLTETLGFDRVLVVAGGRVVEDDAPAALAAREGSCFARLLADEAAAAALWDRWRRIRLEGGRVVEAPR